MKWTGCHDDSFVINGDVEGCQDEDLSHQFLGNPDIFKIAN